MLEQFFCHFHAARLAVQAGAAGIIVSNHGARQLDYVPATIMALEEVPELMITDAGEDWHYFGFVFNMHVSFSFPFQ
jgi:hypothetical protein